MTTRFVGPNQTFHTIAAAMLVSGPNDVIVLDTGYSNETATVTQTGMTISGGLTSTGIVLNLATGIPLVTLTGAAPINVFDADDANSIVGNDGNNVITVAEGADAVDGGLGIDRLVVDYSLATGAVTGDSTSNFAEAGGSRLVTITAGTFEHFTILTGSGADTITTGAGDDIINTGEGASTVTAGQGSNSITGGSGADTITALDGGNFIDGGDGTNNLTSGGGADVILSGIGADTIVAGAGDDMITVRGGPDTVAGGADTDRLIVDYSALVTAVTGGVTGGTFAGGYTGHIADLAGSLVDFNTIENFTIVTGSGNDNINTGDGSDVLVGGSGIDTLSAGAGGDTIYGGTGADSMDGGTGNDFLFVDNAADTIIEAIGGGSDRVLTSVSYALTAAAEVERFTTSSLSATTAINLTGNAFGQIIQGNAGVNVINGAGGSDLMQGFGGNDYYYVDNNNDLAYEAIGGGSDRVLTSVSYTLTAGSEIELFTTTNTGGTTAINLTGNALAQTIQGNAGANVLNGGAGNDAMTGFGGVDAFVFDTALNASTNRDLITDFSHAEDSIWLENAIFTQLGAGIHYLNPAFFHAGAQAADANDYIVYNQSTGALYYDVNGSGAGGAVQFATLTSRPTIMANDFIVI